MSFPVTGSHTRHFTANDIELIAGETIVTVKRTLGSSKNKIRLLDGREYDIKVEGVEMPLWLALFACRFDHVAIVPPAALSVESLRKAIADEPLTQGRLAQLPFDVLTVGHMLLSRAPGCFGSSLDAVRSALDDLQALRRDKLRTLAKGAGAAEPAGVLVLGHATAMEVHEHAGLLRGAVGAFHHVSKAVEAAENPANA